jgi:hypothetical protein
VAHICNPSYSGGRDKESCSSKPAWAYSSQDLILKKRPNTKKRAGRVAQGVGPEFKSQYHQKQKTKKKSQCMIPFVLNVQNRQKIK